MSASDDIKNMLGQVYGPTDWKRISKRIHKTPHDNYPIREFKNNQGDIVTVVSEMDDTMHLPYKAGNVVFGIYHRDDDINVVFADKNGYGHDRLVDIEYWNTVMDFVGPGMPSYLSRSEEAIFSVSDASHDITLVRTDCEALGYTYSRTISEEWGDADELDDPVSPAAAQLIALTQTAPDDDEDEYGYTAAEVAEWKAAPFIIFGVYSGMGGICASFATPEQWVRDGHLDDRHLTGMIANVGLTLPDYIHEMMENCFAVWEDWMNDSDEAEPLPKHTTKASLTADLIAAGFVLSPTLDAYVDSNP